MVYLPLSLKRGVRKPKTLEEAFELKKVLDIPIKLRVTTFEN
jgi:hypothetical protein